MISYVVFKVLDDRIMLSLKFHQQRQSKRDEEREKLRKFKYDVVLYCIACQ